MSCCGRGRGALARSRPTGRAGTTEARSPSHPRAPAPRMKAVAPAPTAAAPATALGRALGRALAKRNSAR
jgi:hypothetical protein